MKFLALLVMMTGLSAQAKTLTVDCSRNIDGLSLRIVLTDGKGNAIFGGSGIESTVLSGAKLVQLPSPTDLDTVITSTKSMNDPYIPDSKIPTWQLRIPSSKNAMLTINSKSILDMLLLDNSRHDRGITCSIK